MHGIIVEVYKVGRFYLHCYELFTCLFENFVVLHYYCNFPLRPILFRFVVVILSDDIFLIYLTFNRPIYDYLSSFIYFEKLSVSSVLATHTKGI